MSTKALVQPFLDQPVFQGLSPLQITEIARRADRIVYKPGDFIITEDDEADATILIVAGEAIRTAGPDLKDIALPVAPGSLIAEMAMLVDTHHTSTIVAKTPVRAMRITRAELHEQMEIDPAVADHFLQQVVGNLHRIGAELRAIDQAFSPGADGTLLNA